MIRQRRRLIALAALAFAWTLLVHAPAALLYGWLAPGTSTTQLYGVDGTLGEGTLSALAVNGNPLLREVHWKLQPLWLLLARASFRIDSGAPIALRGSIGVTPLATHVSGAHVSAGLKSLLSAGGAYLPIDGALDGDIDSLVFNKRGIPTAATATLQLRGLNWALAKPPLQLGDFRLDLSNDGDAIVGKIQSTAGPLDAQGLARLEASGAYDYDIRVKAKPQADEMTQNLLHSMGQPDAQGYYHARTHAQLPGAAAPAGAH